MKVKIFSQFPASYRCCGRRCCVVTFLVWCRYDAQQLRGLGGVRVVQDGSDQSHHTKLQNLCSRNLKVTSRTINAFRDQRPLAVANFKQLHIRRRNVY